MAENASWGIDRKIEKNFETWFQNDLQKKTHDFRQKKTYDFRMDLQKKYLFRMDLQKDRRPGSNRPNNIEPFVQRT